jgi:hypothetical protein
MEVREEHPAAVTSDPGKFVYQLEDIRKITGCKRAECYVGSVGSERQ